MFSSFCGKIGNEGFGSPKRTSLGSKGTVLRRSYGVKNWWGGPSAWAGVNSETRNQKLEIGEQKLEISSEERSRSLAALGMTGGGEEERGKTRNQKAETRKQNVEEKMAA
ncbi:MAG: hypothetical protein DMG46_17130 [Acidobacteria bacterium]|nr:MAG: hypothetical protein DMG46_17130 [Acidobacteriota bacterium]